MSQAEEDEKFGPVGAPQEDLSSQDAYDGVTQADDTAGSATPQVEQLPGEVEDR